MLLFAVNSVPKWMEFILGLVFGLSPIAITFLVKLIICDRAAGGRSADQFKGEIQT